MAEPSELDTILGEKLGKSGVKLEDVDPIFAAPPPDSAAPGAAKDGKKEQPGAEVIKFLQELDPKYYGAALGGYFGPRVQRAAQGALSFPSAEERRAKVISELVGQAKTEQDLAKLIELRGGPPAKVPTAEAFTPRYGGEKWVSALSDVNIPGAQMGKADLDLAKGMAEAVGRSGEPGFVGGKVSPGGVLMPPERSPAKLAAQMAAQPAPDAVASQLERQIAQRVSETGPLRQAARAVARPAMGVLGGAGVGLSGVEAYQKAQAGDIPGAAIAGGAGLAGLASMFAPAAAPVALGLGTLGAARDVYRQRLEPGAPVTPENIEYASKPAFVGPRMPRRYGLGRQSPDPISSALMGELDQQLKQFSGQ